jgi:hypothetical protein
MISPKAVSGQFPSRQSGLIRSNRRHFQRVLSEPSHDLFCPNSAERRCSGLDELTIRNIQSAFYRPPSSAVLDSYSNPLGWSRAGRQGKPEPL